MPELAPVVVRYFSQNNNRANSEGFFSVEKGDLESYVSKIMQEFRNGSLDSDNLVTKEVKLEPAEKQGDFTQIKRNKALSFFITDKEIIKISDRILEILRDPSLVLKYLQKLDQDLGEKLRESKIEVIDNRSQFLILHGSTLLMAGPWPEGYVPYRKNKILNQLLLEREMSSGLILKPKLRSLMDS